MIVAMMSSSFLLMNYYRSLEAKVVRGQLAMYNNIQSAFTFVLSNQNSLYFTNNTVVQGLNAIENDIHFKISNWGLFYTAVASSTWNNRTLKKAALLGHKQENNPFALRLMDRNKPLSVCGSTKIRGFCYLPKSGIKRAYVEGQSYQGNDLPTFNVKVNELGLEPLNNQLIDNNSKYLAGDILPDDSLIYLNEIPSYLDTISNSFFNSRLCIKFADRVILEDITITGNVSIYSPVEIIIGQNTVIQDALLYSVLRLI